MMTTALTDTRLHMWAFHVAPEFKPASGYGVCGVHIGRFTSRPSEVDCNDCLAILNKKKEPVND